MAGNLNAKGAKIQMLDRHYSFSLYIFTPDFVLYIGKVKGKCTLGIRGMSRCIALLKLLLAVVYTLGLIDLHSGDKTV